MMRGLYVLATLAFWVAIAMLWNGARDAGRSAPAAVAGSAVPRYTLQDVATHDREDDCWMAIDGAVHDVSAYVPQHPARREVITEWCGREASQAYATKGRDRPHSAEASRRLRQYRIGDLDTDAAGARQSPCTMQPLTPRSPDLTRSQALITR
jgi:Cytochrome b5-like Heme/Steroid binding domain